MLKLLACLLMLVDHVGVFLVPPSSPYYIWLRVVGRLAFPIFAYGVAIGFTRTRSPYRYLLRMALWAAGGQVLIRLAGYLAHATPESVWYRIDLSSWTNVLVTFTFAIVMLGGIEVVLRSSRDRVASLRPVGAAPGAAPAHFGVRFNPAGLSFPPLLGIPLGLVLAVLPFYAVTVLHSDYDVFGLLTVLVFYVPIRIWPPAADGRDLCRAERYVAQGVGFAILLVVFTAILPGLLPSPFPPTLPDSLRMSPIEAVGFLSLPLIWIPWRDRKPTKFVKWAFYAFYPVHFALLVLLHGLLAGKL